MIVMREIPPRPAAEAWLERAFRRLRVLGRRSVTRVLINARAGHLGTGTQMSAYPTNRELSFHNLITEANVVASRDKASG